MVLQLPYQCEHPNGQGNKQQHVGGEDGVEPGHLHAAADEAIDGGHSGEDHVDDAAGLGDVVDHAGDKGRGLAALHLPHGQVEDLVPQQLSGPKRDLLDAVLAAEVAEHGDHSVEYSQQRVADDDVVVKLALVDLDDIFGDSQKNLGIDETEH